jgi:uncharacterized protein (DUF983 family)
MPVDQYETVSAKITSGIAACPHCNRTQIFGVIVGKLQAVRCMVCGGKLKIATREDHGVLLMRRHWEEDK